MSYNDKSLSCRDCGKEFVFTEGEQRFHAEKGFTNVPSRCPDCRAARKSTGGFGGGNQSDRGAREMHTATCSECGGQAKVPFVPRGDKPVYCSECFQKQRDSAGSSRW